MRTLDLNAYGVSEMSHQEMLNETGGFWGALLASIAFALAWDIANDPAGSKAAWNEGQESARSNFY
jgi:hypothetical protein